MGMDPGAAKVLGEFIHLVEAVSGAFIASYTTIYVAKLHATRSEKVPPTDTTRQRKSRTKQRKEPIKETELFSVSVVASLICSLAVVSVFVYIPIVSNYALWFAVAAFIILIRHYFSEK
jgi:amino acid transporter